MKHINGVSMLVTVTKRTFHRPGSGWPHSQHNQYNLKDGSDRRHGIHRPKCMWLQECQHRSFTYSMTTCNITLLIFWCFEMIILGGGLNDTLYSSVMRAGSVSMQVIVFCMSNVDLKNNIFQSVFAHDTQAQLLAF